MNDEIFSRKFVHMHAVYRHFKDGLYYAICVAEHSETGERLVVYHSLKSGKIYARPYGMFASEVDRRKHPDASQKWRFEEVSE